LDDTPAGTVHVFCTHLAAILPGLQYEGSYGDFTGENDAHVQALIAWVDEKAKEGEKVIVLGDLNTGPAGDGIEPSVADNYARLPEAGFVNAYLDGPMAACTFCKDNPLVISGDTAVDATIDHILTRGIDEGVSIERIFDQRVKIEVPKTTPDGGMSTELEERELALSDHYGLRATISNAR
jgi:endonuclease/exonuclease/phosphatase family metal-dependent hydrolase